MSPMSSSSIEATTMRVISRPRTKTWTTKSPMSRAACGYRRSTRGASASRKRDALIGADSATGVFRALEADARRRSSGAGEGSGDEQAGRGGAGCGDEQSGQERADERSDAFAGARGDVRRHQLAWRARERGEERALDRPNQRPCAGDDRRERVGRLDGQLGGDDERGRGGPRRPHEVDRSEHPITAIALHQCRRERGGDDRRNDSDGAEDPGRERSSGVVGDDEQDDEERPVGRGSRRPGDLDPANRAVSEDVSDRDGRRRGCNQAHRGDHLLSAAFASSGRG